MHAQDKVDTFKIEAARIMFENNVPREIWMKALCEAYNLENNLPSNSLEILQGLIEDQQTTHAALYGNK